MKLTSTKFVYDGGFIMREQIVALYLDELCKDRRFKIVLRNGVVITMPLYMSRHFNYKASYFLKYLEI